MAIELLGKGIQDFSNICRKMVENLNGRDSLFSLPEYRRMCEISCCVKSVEQKFFLPIYLKEFCFSLLLKVIP
jgi:hypothetical protein